jgi:hypothetical protein
VTLFAGLAVGRCDVGLGGFWQGGQEDCKVVIRVLR